MFDNLDGLCRLLTLAGNQINGTLPPSWGQNSALPKLAILALSNNNVSGTFPDAWASGAAFPSMRGSGNGMCAIYPTHALPCAPIEGLAKATLPVKWQQHCSGLSMIKLYFKLWACHMLQN